MTIIFQNVIVLRAFFAFLHTLIKIKSCTPNITLKKLFFATHAKAKFKVLN